MDQFEQAERDGFNPYDGTYGAPLPTPAPRVQGEGRFGNMTNANPGWQCPDFLPEDWA